jgi:O-antigen/teichoic acid export membrane protein
LVSYKRFITFSLINMKFSNIFSVKYNSFGKGQQRLIKAVMSGGSSLFVRLLSIAIGLISIPLTAKYLGAERFGMWLILSTFLSWVGVADFGLGNSLKNVLATADGREDKESAKIAVSSVFYITIVIAVIFSSIFSLAYPQIAWEKIFNVTSSLAKADSGSTIIIIACLFLIRLIFSIPVNIYHSYQESYIYNFWEVFTSVISIASLIVAISYKATLPILVVAGFGGPILAAIFSAIHIFGWKRPWITPNLKHFRWDQGISLIRLGAQFWLVQIAAIVLLQTDLIIVAQMFGSADVAKYGMALKLFGIISMIQVCFTSPLWTAYSEAIAKKDYGWITKTFKRSVVLSAVWSVGACGLLVVFGQQLILLLTKQDMVPDASLLIAMSLTTIITGLTQPLAMLLNGLGEIKIQFILGPPSAIFNLILSIILSQYLGIIGVSLGTSITISISLVIYAMYSFSHLRKINYLSCEQQ